MMRWGILQRYVAKEVFRSFMMALIALTTILVLFVLVAKAATSLALWTLVPLAGALVWFQRQDLSKE